jgi:ketosteroid isomerase-like protein
VRLIAAFAGQCASLTNPAGHKPLWRNRFSTAEAFDVLGDASEPEGGLPVLRDIVDRFRAAYALRDADQIAEFLADDVEWTISGPVEYLQFCGTHRGKANVVDLIKRQIPQVLRTFSFEPEAVVVDGDEVAMLHRQSSRRTEDDRVINYRVANFIRFRDGKIAQNLSLLDTFDAVEQVLGQRIQFDVGNKAAPADGVIAV